LKLYASMKENNRQVWQICMGLAALLAAIYVVWPRLERHVLFQQLSPGFIHHRFVTEATTLQLKTGSSLRQRMWIPTAGVDEFDLAIGCPIGGAGAKLAVSGDEQAMPGGLLGRTNGVVRPYGEICELSFATPFLMKISGQWVWAEFTPTTTPVLVFREQSTDHYPGGDLVLTPHGKHITSVLSFRLWQFTYGWRIEGMKFVLMVGLLLVFVWGMINTLLSE